MRWFNIFPLLLPFVADASPLLPPRQATSSAGSVAQSASIAALSAESSVPAAASSAVQSSANSAASASNTPSTSGGHETILSRHNNVENAAPPTVSIYPDTSDGKPITLTGTRMPDVGQDVYLGIPFARPRT